MVVGEGEGEGAKRTAHEVKKRRGLHEQFQKAQRRDRVGGGGRRGRRAVKLLKCP